MCFFYLSFTVAKIARLVEEGSPSPTCIDAKMRAEKAAPEVSTSSPPVADKWNKRPSP